MAGDQFDAFDFASAFDDYGGYMPTDFDYGAFDPGAFETPAFAEPLYAMQPPDIPMEALQGYFYDTTADEIVDPAGQRTALAEILREGAGGPGRGVFTPGETAAPYGGPGGPPIPGGGGGGVFGRGGVLGEGGPVFGSPLGRAGIAGALGLTGLGLGRLIAGGEPRLRMPEPRQAAGFRAGEQALLQALGQGGQEGLAGAAGAAIGGQRITAEMLRERAAREGLAEAEQAPFQRETRLGALGLMPRFMPGGPEDEVAAAVRAETLRALDPNYRDPLVEEAIRRKEAELSNALYRQLGSREAAEASTPGIDIQLQAAREAGLGRSAARRAAIGTYAPMQQNLMAGIQGLRRQNLADVERLSDFGLRGMPETLTGLRSVFPVAGALSPEGAQRTADIGSQLEAQQALTAFGQRSQRQRELAGAVGGVFGQVAQAATSRPSALERYFDQLIMNQGGGWG